MKLNLLNGKKELIMANCVNCEHAIFDEHWGEYKCKIKKHVVYNYEHVGCDSYKKGTPTPAKHESYVRES